MFYKAVSKIKAFDAILLKSQKIIVVVLGSFIALAIALVILGRMIFGNAFLGTEEVVLICAMWFYMFGASIVSAERSHLSANILPLMIKNEKALSGLKLLRTLITLVIALAMVSWCYDFLAWALLKKQIMPATKLPWYISQGALFVASLFFIWYFLRDLICDSLEFWNYCTGNRSPEQHDESITI